jgi:peptide methionine sulfoxide reductase MsrB
LFQYRYHKTTPDRCRLEKVLPEDVYEVTRNADTERPFTGKYWNTDEKGTYYCAAVTNYFVQIEFSSSCGWPSFFEQENKNSVIYKETIRWAWNRLKLFVGRCAAI